MTLGRNTLNLGSPQGKDVPIPISRQELMKIEKKWKLGTEEFPAGVHKMQLSRGMRFQEEDLEM